MKFSTIGCIAAACTAAFLGGCVVTPVAVQPAYAAPSGVVYVAPAYATPGPGYVWAYHSRWGWGWHHPNYGWHRGWR